MSTRRNPMGYAFCSESTHLSRRWRGWDEDLSAAWDMRSSPFCVLNQKGRNRKSQRRRRRRRRRLNVTW
jgi:hypothetical protein